MCKHLEKLAQEIRKGAASVDGVDPKLWQMQLVASGGLNNLLVSQPESSTAPGLKVVVKKPLHTFLFQTNTSSTTLASILTFWIVHLCCHCF
ncbi:unnamed protein product [Brassica napus]|uniref:(rape) hypothetical protein n=1 Tax=Brassica napus TaxID=3708 RepID=A0A816X6E5_BRANA|nr:unnamed protein product [Brassica napus]